VNIYVSPMCLYGYLSKLGHCQNFQEGRAHKKKNLSYAFNLTCWPIEVSALRILINNIYLKHVVQSKTPNIFFSPFRDESAPRHKISSIYKNLRRDSSHGRKKKFAQVLACILYLQVNTCISWKSEEMHFRQ
jgi:hypothetical protein